MKIGLMDVDITLEREHNCDVIKNNDVICIQTLENRTKWYWVFVENKNTLKERLVAHEIKCCPYCGEKLKINNDDNDSDTELSEE